MGFAEPSVLVAKTEKVSSVPAATVWSGMSAMMGGVVPGELVPLTVTMKLVFV